MFKELERIGKKLTMKLTKYKLGDLIVQRREKNNNYDVPIRGVSKDGFIPAKQKEADTSIYNVFYKYDFVFNPARMELNSIALNLEYDKALCSSLYEVFYVKDESVVLPEFLNLHIKRDEFARHCDYIGLGSAREYCRFANIAEFDIELPPIEVQEEIVEADRLIKQSIRLNNQMIQNLEATAQALYRKTFVENIDKENLPEGWRMGTIGDMLELQRGFDLPSQARVDGKYPIYTSTGIAEYHNEYKVEPPCIVTGRSGTIGEVFYSNEKCWPLNTTLWVKDFKGTPSFFVYYKLKELDLGKTVSGFAAVPTLNRNDVHMMETVVPPKDILLEFDSQMQIIHNNLCCIEQENEKLTELQSLLLAKMGQ